jgi:hypothetical protein
LQAFWRWRPLAALNFTATGDRVACGSAAMLDNLDSHTALAWVYRNAAAVGGRKIYAKGDNPNHNFQLLGISGDIQFNRVRATTNTIANTNTTPLALNTWVFLAVSFDTGASAGNVAKIYHGTLTTPAAEAGYSANNDGSGAPADDSAADFAVGNRSTGASFDQPFPGRIAFFTIYDRVLTLAEIRTMQFRPFCQSPACKLFLQLGWGGSGTQADLSGNGNNCTVTGATVADHAPTSR